ncbi:MAG TPA: hypothetical protein VIV55_10045 [Flavobacterium sp.]
MEAEEQNKEQEPSFVFKEVDAVGTTDSLPNLDVVEIENEEKKIEEVDFEEEEKKEEKDNEEEEIENEEEEDVEIEELDEELAYSFLKEKRGLEFETIDDFLKSKQESKADPEFEKFKEYKAKTGRGYGDFLETQKDWSKETPEAIIKANLKLENPELSNEDIDFLFDKDYSFDEDIDDDYDIKSKKISLKVDAKKALNALEKQKEDYLVVRGSTDDDIPEDYRDAKELVELLYDEQVENEQKFKKAREQFVSKTSNMLNEKFEGFKFSIDGQDYRVKPENIKETKDAQSDIANFSKKFFDKEENLIDPEGYHKALYMAMNPEKVATHFYNLGKTAYAENLEKESKNIDVKGEKHIPSPELGTFTFKKV